MSDISKVPQPTLLCLSYMGGGARPFDVYQGWRVGPSAISLRPDLCRRHLEAATWRLPERRAACCDHSPYPYQTPPPLPPLLHHRSTTTPRNYHRSAALLYVCLLASSPPPCLVTPPVRAPRFHVLTSKVRQAADSLRSSTLFYQTPPTISITPLR